MIWWVAIGISALACPLVWWAVYDMYKEREWRRNNPDEHDIMNKKINDDFSDK
jgi:hypothetical protein